MIIHATGSHTPGFSLTNEMLSQTLDTSDEWIVSRTGISSRPLAEPEETNLGMALAACRQALEGVDISRVVAVVVATVTPDCLTPSTACRLAGALGLPESIFAMDLNGACCGFLIALRTCHAMLKSAGEIGLVVASEMLSRVVDYTDRSTCVLFGDGAGAMAISLDDEPFAFDTGVIPSEDAIRIPATYLANGPYAPRPSAERTLGGMVMDGPAVFRFAIQACCESVNRTLDSAGLSVGDINLFVFHQANLRILAAIAGRLGIGLDRCEINIQNHGNTSAASLPIAFDGAVRRGRVRPGARILFAAFGSGLTWASALVQVNPSSGIVRENFNTARQAKEATAHNEG